MALVQSVIVIRDGFARRHNAILSGRYVGRRATEKPSRIEAQLEPAALALQRLDVSKFDEFDRRAEPAPRRSGHRHRLCHGLRAPASCRDQRNDDDDTRREDDNATLSPWRSAGHGQSFHGPSDLIALIQCGYEEAFDP